MNEKHLVSFGSTNIETGEIQTGYIEDGEMKYKKESWWKRIFRKPPSKVEFIKTIIRYNSYSENYVSLYREFNPYTNKSNRIFTLPDNSEFDINSYEINGKMVKIN